MYAHALVYGRLTSSCKTCTKLSQNFNNNIAITHKVELGLHGEPMRKFSNFKLCMSMLYVLLECIHCMEYYTVFQQCMSKVLVALTSTAVSIQATQERFDNKAVLVI